MMRQIYENYTPEDHKVWQLLFERQMQQLPAVAAPAYLEGIHTIGFKNDRIPNFDEVNKVLGKLTGWQIEVVEGLIPNQEFYGLLAKKRFPASTWLRKMEELDYLEEPDMFHDVFGHLPMLTNAYFCDFLKGFSQIALRYLDNAWGVEMIARLYWYTVEFGLIRNSKTQEINIFGAGIMSSSGESVYCLGEKPQRVAYDPAQIIQTPYIIDRFQDKYFVIESYEQLYHSLSQIDELIEENSTVSV